MPTFDWPRDPAWQPMAGRFHITSVSRMSRSPYSPAIKAINSSALWMAEISWNNKENKNTGLGQDIQAFLESLEGSANPVRMFDFWRTGARLLKATAAFSDGTFFTDGTGWIEGYAPTALNAQTKGDRVLVLQGLTANKDFFVRGDVVGVGGYMYQVMAGARTNAFGQVALTILPGLRANVAISDSVNLDYVTVPMRLVSGGDSITHNFHWTEGFSLTFVEDIP